MYASIAQQLKIIIYIPASTPLVITDVNSSSLINSKLALVEVMLQSSITDEKHLI